MTGIEVYPTDRLYEEVSFIAYYLGWSRDEILTLPHWERQRWCREISRINEEKNRSEGRDVDLGPDPRVEDVPVADFDDSI